MCRKKRPDLERDQKRDRGKDRERHRRHHHGGSRKLETRQQHLVGPQLHGQQVADAGDGRRAVDDRLDVGLEGIDILTPEPIVRPGLDHEHSHRLLEQPIDPAERSRGGLAAHTGIHCLEREPDGVDFLLNQCGIGLGLIETVPGREAGPEEDDPH